VTCLCSSLDDIANQDEYWDFFTIKLPLEIADQALSNGLICLTEA